MKLLFAIDRAFAQDDPNINLVRGLLPVLTPEHTVRFLGHTAQLSEANVPRDTADTLCFYYGIDDKVRTLFFSLAGLSAGKKLLQLLRHPWLSFLGSLKLLHIDLIAGAYRRAIVRACTEFCPDAVIAVAAPFYTAKAVAAAHICCKKIIWMFDPYGAHYLMGGAIAKRQEAHCIQKVDMTFVPEQLVDAYSTKNVQAMAFPGLVAPVETEAQSTDAPLYGQGKINLAFVGSLYADIRNPAPLLRLLQQMDDDTLHLTIVGGLYGKYSDDFHKEFDDFLARHVTFVDKVSKEVAMRYMLQADVLVNIGNTVQNQLPSKIFEYFSTGRPVLNLKQLAACPANAYMQRYPLSFTLFAAQPTSAETVQAAHAFLCESAGKRLPFAQVEQLFLQNTQSAVAKKLLAAAKGE